MMSVFNELDRTPGIPRRLQSVTVPASRCFPWLGRYRRNSLRMIPAKTFPGSSRLDAIAAFAAAEDETDPTEGFRGVVRRTTTPARSRAPRARWADSRLVCHDHDDLR